MPTQQQVLKRITLHSPPTERRYSPARYFTAGLVCGAALSLGAGLAVGPEVRTRLVELVASRGPSGDNSAAPSPTVRLTASAPLSESQP